MSEVKIVDQVGASAASVWSLVREFGGIEKWSGPGIEGCTVEGDGIGAVRTIRIAGGNQLQERLEALDDAERSFSYAIIGQSPLPVKDYLATLQVIDSGTDSCTVEWSSTFQPAGADEEQVKGIVAGIYKGGIGGIKKALGV